MELVYGKYLKSLENEVFSRIERALSNNTRAYVIVPSQAKFLMEAQILNRCGAAGFMMLEVISFEKLTDYVLDKVNGRAISRIDAVGLAMLVREILSELTLNVLDAEKDDSLHEALSKLILALKAEDISPAELREMAQTRTGSIAEKLLDIAAVYERLEEYHDAGLWDMNRAEDHARAHLAEFEALRGTEIIIHGFDMIPASRIRTIVALLRAGCRVTVTLEADEEDDVFARQLRTMYALEAAARAGGSSFVKTQLTENVVKAADILHIEENLYRYPTAFYDAVPQNVRVVRAKSRREEIVHAAQTILERGVPLSEVAILAARPETYMTAIAEVFPKAGISWFFENKRKLREHRLSTLLLAAAGILGENRWQDFEHLIKTGLLPIDDEAGDVLLRYAAEHGKKSYAREWKTASTEIEQMRAQAVADLLTLAERARTSDAAALAGILKEYLEALHAEEEILQEEQTLRELGLTAEAQFAAQVYEKTLHILGQLQRFGKGIARKHLRAMLETGLCDTEIAVVPQCREQVNIGDITHSIFPQKKLMIVLGANDGVLISRMDGGLFSEREVEELSKDRFFPGYISVRDQRLFLRRALTSAEQLEVLYNTEDGPEAMAVHRLKRIFPQLAEQEAKSLRTAQGLLCEAVRELQNGEWSAAAVLMNDPAGKEQLTKLVAEAARGNAATPIPQETAARIYENASNNVSRIETFYQCPFRQFVSYGLKPQIPRSFEEDALNAGSYVHALIEAVSRKLSGDGLAGVTDTMLRELIDEVAQTLHETHNRGIFSETARFTHIEAFLKEEVFYALAAVRDQLEGTGIAIVGTEQGFGGRRRLEVDTPMGKIALTGKIDRIDLLERDGKRMVRVVDYKTGSPETPSERNISRGTSLQLITYLIAVLSIYQNAVPAGAHYMKVRLDYKQSEEERKKGYQLTGITTDAGKREMMGNGCFSTRASVVSEEELEALMDCAKARLGEAVTRIAAGDNRLQPVDEKACTYCDYHAICCHETDDAENE